MRGGWNVPLVGGAFSALVAVYAYLHLFIVPATPILRGGDQWLFAQSGARILTGQLPYRDFWEMLTPGTDLLYAGLFCLFGQRVAIANALVLITAVVLAWLVARISRSLQDGTLVFTSVLVVLLIIFRYTMEANHHWFSALAALAAVVSLLESRALPRVGMAGAFCALSSFFTQTRGLAVVAALAAFFRWETTRAESPPRTLRNRLLVLLVAYVAVVCLALSYFLITVGPYQVFASLVLFPARYYASYNQFSYWRVGDGPVSSVAELPSLAAAVFLRVLPATYLLLLFMMKRLTACDAALRARVVLLAFVGTALFIEVINAPTGPRLAVTAIPACILALWSLNLHGFLSTRRLTAGFLLLLLFSIVDTIAVQNAGLGVLDLPSGRAAFLKRAWYEDCSYLAGRTSPGDWYFGDNWLLFPLQLRNPAFVPYVTNTDLTRPEHVRNLVSSLDRHQVAYLTWFPENFEPGLPGHDHLQPLREYVHAHYKPAYKDFLKRNR
jgi:hypothetical protein